MSLGRTFEAKTRSLPFTPRTKIAPPKARTFSPLRHARVAASPSPNSTLTLARGLSTHGLSQNGYSLSLSLSLSLQGQEKEGTKPPLRARTRTRRSRRVLSTPKKAAFEGLGCKGQKVESPNRKALQYRPDHNLLHTSQNCSLPLRNVTTLSLSLSLSLFLSFFLSAGLWARGKSPMPARALSLSLSLSPPPHPSSWESSRIV